MASSRRGITVRQHRGDGAAIIHNEKSYKIIFPTKREWRGLNARRRAIAATREIINRRAEAPASAHARLAVKCEIDGKTPPREVEIVVSNRRAITREAGVEVACREKRMSRMAMKQRRPS